MDAVMMPMGTNLGTPNWWLTKRPSKLKFCNWLPECQKNRSKWPLREREFHHIHVLTLWPGALITLPQNDCYANSVRPLRWKPLQGFFATAHLAAQSGPYSWLSLLINFNWTSLLFGLSEVVTFCRMDSMKKENEGGGEPIGPWGLILCQRAHECDISGTGLVETCLKDICFLADSIALDIEASSVRKSWRIWDFSV